MENNSKIMLIHEVNFFFYDIHQSMNTIGHVQS